MLQGDHQSSVQMIYITLRYVFFFVSLVCIQAQLIHLSHHLLFLQGYNEDHQYEEIPLQDQQGSTVVTVYALVSPPSDTLHSASVNFLKDRNTLPEDNGSSACNTNAPGGTHPPPEISLYSTVKSPEDH